MIHGRDLRSLTVKRTIWTYTVSDDTRLSLTTTARAPSPADSLVEDDYYTAPPPHSPSEASASTSSFGPPPFSSLFFALPSTELNQPKYSESGPASLSVFAPPPPVEEPLESVPSSSVVADTKASFSEPKSDRPGKSTDDGEPPPPYTEGYSPLESFTYVMAAAGGASSIITQVQQTGGPPINTLGGMSAYS
ncbi:dipeptidyl peptidase 3 [Penicillium maclennaniae]|uniref:dipeptidyl peptidase 3 n=1 Tax=Penicillium maclennaniae TaxID=1343394 RepID=UPI002541289E|nr:dipeptidyl peptidase 3 [Penicillium maclennaniae]KAJ5665634.1 dipeptidyl peptidase 3 [Penicillium maclennaniae]